MKALDGLTDGLFDYAGLFPPAGLAFEEMLNESASLPDRLTRPGIVGSDLVLKPEHIDRITTDHLEQAGFHKSRHVRICLVGVPAENGAQTANDVIAFNREGRFETIPHDITALEMHSNLVSVDATANALMPARFVMAGQDTQIYWEPILDDSEWNDRLEDVFAVIDGCNSESELPIVGLKVRCGGPRALSAPTLARILPEVSRRAIPFKATQGLHHPLAGMADNDIGFIGLATALRLHEEGALSDQEIRDCITEPDAAAFDFQGGLAWRDHRIDLGGLGHAMQMPFSIGSCSVTEPDEGLATLWPLAAAPA